MMDIRLALAVSRSAGRGDVDLDDAMVKVERSLEESNKGLRFKAPKTKHGRRAIPLPPTAADVLRAHKVRQLELRMALGQGKPEPSALVFCTVEGEPLSPDDLSRDWWPRAREPVDHARRLCHMFRDTGREAADAIEAVLRKKH